MTAPGFAISKKQNNKYNYHIHSGIRHPRVAGTPS